MITATKLSKQYGAQVLFVDADLQLNPGCRYGMVGANGSGKSTLLRILASQEEPTAGSVQIPKRARVGVLHQDHFRYEATPILDVVLMGNAELWEAMQAKEEILAAAHESFDADRYQAAEDVVLRYDGYAVEALAGEVLEGLAIPSARHREPLSVLSGGFKLRVLLAQTLAASPEVLLLDEPTNHLDIVSIRWLEKFLVGYPGTVAVVSHDHRFLDNVCTHIIDVDYERVTLYKGDYQDFEEAKAGDRERLEAEISKRDKEVADHKAFIQRFKAKASKARQAQSRMKRIARMTFEDLPRSSRRYPHFHLAQERPSGRVALTLDGISKAFGSEQVLSDVSLTVQRGDRLAIIGPNGIGKSTLLKIAMGLLDADAGTVEWGYEARPGYYPQGHSELVATAGRQTLKDWLYDLCPAASIGYVHGKLAQVLFIREDVEKRVANLSGGEVARLVFAGLSVTQPNVLVLDEPTNHLDLEGIEALAAGLDAYDGTIVFVSHDRWFVSAVATRILELRPDGIEDFRGSYDEYVARCGDDHLDADVAVAAAKAARRRAGGGS